MLDRETTDRRRSPRVALGEPVEILGRPGTLALREAETATAVDLSTGGVSVVGSLRAEVGDRIHCRILLTPSLPLDLNGRVVWVRQSEGGEGATRQGVGICFEDLTVGTSDRLSKFVSRARSASDETATWDGPPIDRFCDQGTWAAEEWLDLTDHDVVQQQQSQRWALITAIASLLVLVLVMVAWLFR